MMSWRVLSSVICPNTGIVYSHIVGLKLLRLIIWYESDIYLLPGDRIHTTKNGIFVNGVFNHISLYNVSPYNENLWDEIKTKWPVLLIKTWILKTAHTLSIAMRANARTDLRQPR